MEPDPTRAVPERIRLGRTGSTTDVVLGMADGGATEHTMVVAAEQSAARGGSGPWQAPIGGLWFTTLWRPKLDPCSAALLTLAAGWGVREGIRRHTGIAAGLKWPNDIVLDGRKLAGVLVEGRVVGHEIATAAVGVGINVNNPIHELTSGVAAGATSLARELGRDVALDGLLGDVAQSLREARALVSHPEGIVAAFSSCWTQRGGPVSIDTRHTMVEGRALRVDPDGCLVVATDAAEHRIDDPSLAKFVRVV